jgi:hypothetical protein
MKIKRLFAALEAKVVSLRAAGAFAADGVQVDAEKGIIRNCAVMTIGPARGHGFDIDKTSLEQLVSLISAEPDGVLMRFKHPTPEALGDGSYIEPDSLGTDVGRLKNARIDGDSVRGDVYLGEWAKALPGQGDVWSYLISKAKNDPTGFGLSAVIAYDVEPIVSTSGAVTQLVARIESCNAVDFVGKPAANPNGLLAENTAETRTTAIWFTEFLAARAANDAPRIAKAVSQLSALGMRISFLKQTKPPTKGRK